MALVISSLLFSCERDSVKPSWDVDLLIPLVADTITVNDVLDERFFVENPDQSISLAFNEELLSMNIDSLAELPDTLFNYGMRLSFMPDPTIHQPGDTIIAQKFFLPINLQYGDSYGLLLKKAILRSGNIVFEAYQESNVDLQVVLGIIGAEHPETGSFFAVENVPKNQTFQKEYDMSDYERSLDGPDHDTMNMFTYNVALIVDPNEEGEVTIYPHDSIALTIYFRDVVLDYARGYFGQSSFHIGPEDYPFAFFKDLDMEGLAFDDAKINFNIKNTYGVDVNMNLKNITAINSQTSDSVSLESPLMNTDLYIGQATEESSGSGNVTPFETSFDFSNSNFSDLLSIKPDKISYDMNQETNINVDSANFDNFFYYDIPISVNLDAKINGGVKIDSLFQSARMAWNANGTDLSNIKNGELKLVFANAFPFDFSMNLYFEDEEKNKIDTLVYEQFISGGSIGTDGVVSDATVTRISIPVDDGLKETFKNAKYTMYELIISSADGQQVKIHKSDYLKFKVIGDFQYLLEQ